MLWFIVLSYMAMAPVFVYFHERDTGYNKFPTAMEMLHGDVSPYDYFMSWGLIISMGWAEQRIGIVTLACAAYIFLTEDPYPDHPEVIVIEQMEEPLTLGPVEDPVILLE